MSPAPWGETSHLAAAVIVTHAHCSLTAAGHCYVILGTIKFVDKSVNDNGMRRLDHCDVIASGSRLGVPTGVPHSEVELQTEFKSFTAAHLGEREINFICLFGDRGHQGPYSPYKQYNHNLYIGIVIFPHIDNPQAHLGSNTNQHGLNTWRHMHLIQQVSLCPSFSTIRAIAFI